MNNFEQDRSLQDKSLYVVDFEPLPLMRHRHFGKITYNPQRKQMDHLSFMVKSIWNKPIIDYPIKLIVNFYTKIPASLSKKKAKLLEKKPDTRRRDLSNYIKFFEDSCNGVIYQDDALICEIESKKIYSFSPRIEFEIIKL